MRLDSLRVVVIIMLVIKVCLSRQHDFSTVEIFLHTYRAGGNIGYKSGPPAML